MPHIALSDALAWTEPTKVGDNFDALDDALETQVSTIIFARLAKRFSTVGWTTPELTPKLVKTIVAMYYVSFVYDKTYSTDDDLSAYAVLLRSMADLNIAALLEGSVDLPEQPDGGSISGPVFYPNDFSSAQEATAEDSSLGPAAFSMGRVF